MKFITVTGLSCRADQNKRFAFESLQSDRKNWKNAHQNEDFSSFFRSEDSQTDSAVTKVMNTDNDPCKQKGEK